MNTVRVVRLATWLLIAVLAGATGYVIWQAETRPTTTSTVTDAAAIGGPFTLTDTTGARVTEARFAGRPHAIFFGYTHCPDVCPTTLGEMSVMLADMGAEASKLDVYFVTVDPERDTAASMKDYLSAFSDRIVGLTGTEAEIADMVAAYRVYRRKVPAPDGGADYTMDHTAAVYLFDAAGSFKGTISYGEKQEDALAKLKRLAAG